MATGVSLKDTLKKAGEIDEILVGTGDDTVKIDKEGIYSKGLALVYDDIPFNLSGKRLYTTTGKVDFDYDYVMPKFQASGDISNKSDCIFGNEPYPHAYLTTEELEDLGLTGVNTLVPIELHVHWLQFDVADQYKIGIYVRVLNNSSNYTNVDKGIFPTDTNIEEQWVYLEPILGANSDGSSAPSGYTDNIDLIPFDKGSNEFMVQITEVAKFDIIINISAELQIWLTRVDSNINTEDLLMTQVDFHAPKSANGSQEMYKKLAP